MSIEICAAKDVDQSVVRQRSNFAASCAIPNKFADRQPTNISADSYALNPRLNIYVFRSAPAVHDKHLAAGSNCDVLERIIIQAAKLDRARRRCERQRYDRINETLRGIVEDQQRGSAWHAYADDDVCETVGCAEFAFR